MATGARGGRRRRSVRRVSHGYIHETYVPEGAGGGDGYSVATTFQFQDPQPVLQWKNFLTRWGLSHYAREEPCISRMEPYIFLGSSYKKIGAKTDEEVQQNCAAVFRTLDTDGDKRVSAEEIS